jgi:IclR family pca regulon transcriptional regulator
VVDGRVIAAVNIGTQAHRVSLTDLRLRYLPALRRVARDLAAMRPV